MSIKEVKVKMTPRKLQEFIERQEIVENPNQVYITWLKKQLKLACDAEVIKKK